MFGGYSMSKSLFELQGVLENGSNQSRWDIAARKYGFYDGKEYVRYNNWRKANGKSAFIKNIDYTEDLEYWREYVDYKNVGNLISYLSSKGYTVDKHEISDFKSWCSKHKYKHSNRKECLDLFEKYCNRRKLFGKDSKSGKKTRMKRKEDIDNLFMSYRQRCAYDEYCETLGFSILTDRERYLSGIEEWKKSNPDVVSTLCKLLDTKSYRSSFQEWCKNNRIPIGTEEELFSAINRYKKLKEYKKQFKSIQWANREQQLRYGKYCKSLGFTFTSDPERYLSSYQNWIDNIDPGPCVDWKLYFSSVEYVSYRNFCYNQGYSETFRSRGFQERYDKWKNWYENSRDPRYTKGGDTK